MILLPHIQSKANTLKVVEAYLYVRLIGLFSSILNQVLEVLTFYL